MMGQNKNNELKDAKMLGGEGNCTDRKNAAI